MRNKQIRNWREVLNDFHLIPGRESACTNHLDLPEPNMEETQEILLRKCCAEHLVGLGALLTDRSGRGPNLYLGYQAQIWV